MAGQLNLQGGLLISMTPQWCNKHLYCLPGFLGLFPLSLTPTVLELGLQITST